TSKDPPRARDHGPRGDGRARGGRPRTTCRRAHAGDLRTSLRGLTMEQIANALVGQPIIIGAGLAGLLTALHLAPEPVIVLAKAPGALGAASAWAQGGIAAAVGADDDPALHAADTIAAGAGLCDASMVERITAAAPGAIEDLARWGVAFDRSADGRFKLGLEPAHCPGRNVHPRVKRPRRG